jgi:hemerythrin-like domain-containing protein
MNAIKHLIDEHNQIRTQFKYFEEAGDRAYKTKKDASERAIELALMNAKEEEQVLFPALEGRFDEKQHEMILALLEEHRVADFLITRTRPTSSEEDVFDPRFEVLMESLRHHYEEEENEVFPEAQKVLDEEELERLGDEMEELEKRMNA